MMIPAPPPAGAWSASKDASPGSRRGAVPRGLSPHRPIRHDQQGVPPSPHPSSPSGPPSPPGSLVCRLHAAWPASLSADSSQFGLPDCSRWYSLPGWHSLTGSSPAKAPPHARAPQSGQEIGPGIGPEIGKAASRTGGSGYFVVPSLGSSYLVVVLPTEWRSWHASMTRSDIPCSAFFR